MRLLPRDRVEQIQILRDRGMTVRAIAKKIGCAPNTVLRYAPGRKPGRRAPRKRALRHFAGYCRQRLADDPDLSTATLFHELAALGYTGSRPTFYRDLGRYDLLRPFSDNARPRESHHAMPVPTVTTAGSLRPLPVRVSPLAGEELAHYITRVAAGNHLAAGTVLAVLPDWIGHRITQHGDRGTRYDQPSAARNALHQLALLTGVTDAALTNALPAFTTALPSRRHTGPMRTARACRRCAAARGIRDPVPVRLPSHVQVCVRHGIWLSSSDIPQPDITACPEIITAQKRAWRLLRHLSPEQFLFALVTNTHLVQADPEPGWQQRRELLHDANPDLAGTAIEHELTNAAIYPDAIRCCRTRKHASLSKIH